MRRAHHALTPPNLIECPQCGEKVRPHRVCLKCGYYKDRPTIAVDND
jgi:large subunit ribosomal protein L32